MKRLLGGLVGLMVLSVPVLADSLPQRSSAISSWAPEVTPEYKTHNFQVGALGGYGWIDDDFQEATWGAYASYMFRQSMQMAYGVEGDVLFPMPQEFDLRLWSLRGKAGLYVTPTVFAYGTAGAAFSEFSDTGWVAGGGIEWSMTKNVSLRLEARHYDFGDDEAYNATLLGLGYRF